jgi:Signal transduction histidine kinase
MNQMVEELLKEDARRDIGVIPLLDYVQSQISAFSWRHAVTVSMEKGVPGRTLHLNLVRFSRALVNLLDNAHLAVRDAAAPRIVLAVSVAGDRMLFVVSDNGRGFPERFAHSGRQGETGISEWGSTGLGLAFVEEVVKKHGGEMIICNRPEGGARVTLSLPL